MECVQVSIRTIGIEKFFEYHSEIRMRTIDVALSADLNDRENIRHCFVPQILMIKESCNLIGRKNILLNNLEVYVIDE